MYQITYLSHMTDYTISDAYWSRMRDTWSPPPVPWTDSGDADEGLIPHVVEKLHVHLVVNEVSISSSVCRSILESFPTLERFFFEMMSYVAPF